MQSIRHAKLLAAGFSYYIEDDTVRCDTCKLKVQHWKDYINPLAMHVKQKPDCPLVKAAQFSSLTTTEGQLSLLNIHERSYQQRSRELIKLQCTFSISFEKNFLHKLRIRSYSDWPHHTNPSSTQMIEAGFFNCKVGDRVICLHCNLICQQWTLSKCDPWEIHKTLSSNCSYVTLKLNGHLTSSVCIAGENLIGATSNDSVAASKNSIPIRHHNTINDGPYHQNYIELSRRRETFAEYLFKDSTLICNLVQAGFFYNATKAVITCFYCNGSLCNWSSSDNLMSAHIHSFPGCAYAKTLSDDNPNHTLSALEQEKLERCQTNLMNFTANNEILCIDDEDTKILKSITDQLDTRILHKGLHLNYQISIIKRVLDERSRLQRDNSIDDYDLCMACLILQKQIEIINGNEENIIIPSLAIENVRKCIGIVNFKEQIEITIQREMSLADWPHKSPSRLAMLQGGWHRDRMKSQNPIECSYCGVEKQDWNVDDNPLDIHRQLCSSCQFVQSQNPMPQSSVSTELVEKFFQREKIDHYLNIRNNILLPTSNSPYKSPPLRTKSFENFPGSPPQQIEEITRCGFYHTGEGTKVRCYHCNGVLNCVHTLPLNEILIQHCLSFPHCAYATSLPAAINYPDPIGLCQWCCINQSEIIAFPCRHLSICNSCSKIVNTCPKCFNKPKVFLKLFQ